MTEAYVLSSATLEQDLACAWALADFTQGKTLHAHSFAGAASPFGVAASDILTHGGIAPLSPSFFLDIGEALCITSVARALFGEILQPETTVSIVAHMASKAFGFVLAQDADENENPALNNSEDFVAEPLAVAPHTLSPYIQKLSARCLVFLRAWNAMAQRDVATKPPHCMYDCVLLEEARPGILYVASSADSKLCCTEQDFVRALVLSERHLVCADGVVLDETALVAVRVEDEILTCPTSPESSASSASLAARAASALRFHSFLKISAADLAKCTQERQDTWGHGAVRGLISGFDVDASVLNF